MNHIDSPTGLETVEVRSHGSVVALSMLLVITFAMAGSLTWLTWQYRNFLGKQTPVAYAVLGAILALCLWIVYRLLTQVYYWRADGQGLTMSGVFGRGHVRWEEVVDAEVIDSSTSGRGYRLRTKARTITVLDVPSPNAMDLYGSIWVHLQRMPGMEALQPLGTAKSAWDEIPSEVRSIGSWTNPQPPRMWHLYVWVAAITAMGLILLYGALRKPDVEGLVGLVVALVAPWALRDSAREALLCALSLTLDDHSLRAGLRRGIVQIPWSDVVSARWRRNLSDMSLYLLICGSRRGSDVVIPWIASDAQSSKLILAVIERLRTSGRGLIIAIPEGLRSQPTPEERRTALPAADSRSTGRITLHYSPFRLVVLSIGPALFLTSLLALGLGMVDEHRVSPAALPVSLGLTALFFAMLWSCRTDLDAGGVTAGSFRRRTRVDWGEVASYSIRIPSDGSSRTPVYELRDSSGSIILQVPLSMSGKSQRARFESALLARLSSVPVVGNADESWRARRQGRG